MDSNVSISQLIDSAEQHFQFGAYTRGIECLREALSLEPDNGFLHSYLSFALIETKRRTAALYEAEIGLSLSPDSSYGHYTLGYAYLVNQKFALASEHLDNAIEREPDNAMYHLLKSRIFFQQNKYQEALKTIKHALELAPNNCDVLTEYGDILLQLGKVDEAAEFYQNALQRGPQNINGLIGMGTVLLKNNQVQEAREHAIWALQQAPDYAPALRLFTQIKARSNPVMGVWWRLNNWLSNGSNTRMVVLLISGFLLFQVASIVLEDLGHKSVGEVVSMFWLGIVIYSWIGPAWFNRMLKKELETVSLDKAF
ncbi:tetratricopeptide repeat protein [Shewanella woodyi]|uniref:tetratricopeptide repeat protein n=1 Tax=Shewanella woodyi TaxID=60961 RepID=UPI003747F5EE